MNSTALTATNRNRDLMELPAHERAALIGVSQKKRVRALEVRDVLEAFHAEPNKFAVVLEYAARIGKSKTQLNRLYYAWRDQGLAGLLPAKKIDKARGLPAEFVEWFKAEAENHNTDSIPQARRSMVQKLVRGEEIPGLGTWPALYAARFPGVPLPRGVGREYPGNNIETLIPAGYSARNLLRYKSELVESTAARQGSFAASKYGSFVFTTRVGLKVGQVYMMDDVWHNQNVNWMGSTKALRPIELCCIDLLSAHKVAWGARPRLWNPETKRNEIVKEHEFRFLLAYTLCEAAGYRPDGTILWLERGTAAVDEDLESILHELSNKAITVQRASLKEGRQACSVFRSADSGNPRHKAPLESHHSIAHTVLSGIVGQIGRNRDVRPEEVYGRDKANELFIKIGSVLPPELAGLLELPYLQWDEYMECVSVAYDELARRDWHTLEGWEACKFFKKQFCLPPFTDWKPLDALQDTDPAIAMAIYDKIREHPECGRVWPMSPLEVWNRGKHELRLLTKFAMPLILGPKNGIIRECPQAAELTFSSRELGPVPHRYGRDYMDEAGRVRRLEAGTKYLFHINPFSATRELFISTPDCAVLGFTPQIAVPCRVDKDAALERIKQVVATNNAMLKRVSGRHLTQLAKQAAATARNTAIIGAAMGEGMIPMKPKAVPEIEETNSAGSDDADAAILEMCGVEN